MKSLIVPYNNKLAWVPKFFPEHSICSLPVCGKSFAEHLMDLSYNLQVKESILLDCNFNLHLNSDLNEGERWGIQLQYESCEVMRSVDEITSHFWDYIGDEDCLIIYGALLPRVEEISVILDHLIPARDLTEKGIYLYRNHTFYRCNIPCWKLDTLKRYFEVNLALLTEPGVLVLPGYSAEEGVHIGEDVQVASDMLRAPLLLSDHCSISRYSTLKEAIIGKNSIIDVGTEVYRSIVFDNAFVGKNMEFVNKIIYLNRVIDPINEEVLIADAEFAIGTGMSVTPTLLHPFCRVIALFLALLSLPLHFILAPYHAFKPKALYLYKLSYDRYSQSWGVCFGFRQLIHELDSRAPFVFRYSDMNLIHRDPQEQRMDDFYYINYRNIRMILRIVTRALVNRLFVNHVP